VGVERGLDAMQVEFRAPPLCNGWKFPLADFEEALTALRAQMWDLHVRSDMRLAFDRSVDSGRHLQNTAVVLAGSLLV
jgi:hypothetical protein